MEFLFLIIGLVLGFVLAFLFFKSKNIAGADTSISDSKIIELDKQNAVLKSQFENANKENLRILSEGKEEKQRLNSEIEKLRSELNNANARIEGSIEKFKAQSLKPNR